MNIAYCALITTLSGTEHYELVFEHLPSLSEVLTSVHEKVEDRQPQAIPLLTSVRSYTHVVGQDDQLFNDTTVFHYDRDGVWLRIYCPKLLDSHSLKELEEV